MVSRRSRPGGLYQRALCFVKFETEWLRGFIQTFALPPACCPSKVFARFGEHECNPRNYASVTWSICPTSQVTVNLTGVTNVQRITVTLFDVNDGTHMGDVPVSMGMLVRDVNGNAVVNASDVSLTKSQVGQPVSGSNFRGDMNANGLINSVDVALVKSKVGTEVR
jgi:dockerin type I repeat protein